MKYYNEQDWAQKALVSQTACNPSGLLVSALQCIRQYRRDHPEDSQAKECIPLRFIIHQLAFLTGADQYMMLEGDRSYMSDENKLREMAKEVAGE